jgi:hypothetical protein
MQPTPASRCTLSVNGRRPCDSPLST